MRSLLRFVRRLVPWVLMLALVGVWLWTRVEPEQEIVAAERARVADGDTLAIGVHRIRLYGIDAPEIRQSCVNAAGEEWPCGRAARAQLEAMLLQGHISCAVRSTDQYHRKIATCSSIGTADLGRAMVLSGFGISPATRGSAHYAEEEAQARDAKSGIWAGSFTIPADWRAVHGTDHDSAAQDR